MLRLGLHENGAALLPLLTYKLMHMIVLYPWRSSVLFLLQKSTRASYYPYVFPVVRPQHLDSRFFHTRILFSAIYRFTARRRRRPCWSALKRFSTLYPNKAPALTLEFSALSWPDSYAGSITACVAPSSPAL